MNAYDRTADPNRIIKPVIRIGLAACFLFFGGLGLWSYLAPLQGAAIAQGTVVPEGSRRVVQHKEGGIVAEILVQDGDHVNAGDMLIRIADAGSTATKAALERRLVEIEATSLRLAAEEAEDETLEFPEELLRRAERISSMDALRAQASMFQARRESMAAKLEILDAQKAQMRSTIEGLRIQIVDDQKRPMFDIGRATVKEYMRELLHEIGALLNSVDNHVSISGHTDSAPYGSGERGYSNWELSADRANASRRELIVGGMLEDKVVRVVGLGPTVPYDSNDRLNPMNRRISILVLSSDAEERVVSGTVVDTADDGIDATGASLIESVHPAD